jgi:hypothetical protein
VQDKMKAVTETTREALTRDDPWEAIEWLVNHNAAKMAASRGLRDAMSVIDFGDENPWNTDEPRRCAAAVLDRARDARRSARPHCRRLAGPDVRHVCRDRQRSRLRATGGVRPERHPQPLSLSFTSKREHGHPREHARLQAAQPHTTGS